MRNDLYARNNIGLKRKKKKKKKMETKVRNEVQYFIQDREQQNSEENNLPISNLQINEMKRGCK